MKGDILVVLHSDDEWWEGKLQNGDGCAPTNIPHSVPYRPAEKRGSHPGMLLRGGPLTAACCLRRSVGMFPGNLAELMKAV